MIPSYKFFCLFSMAVELVPIVECSLLALLAKLASFFCLFSVKSNGLDWLASLIFVNTSLYRKPSTATPLTAQIKAPGNTFALNALEFGFTDATLAHKFSSPPWKATSFSPSGPFPRMVTTVVVILYTSECGSFRPEALRASQRGISTCNLGCFGSNSRDFVVLGT